MCGHLDCLRYLYENGCPCNGYAFRYAAWGGHLECIKYLHEQGCQKDTSFTVAFAAMRGHLDCVKYLVENGFVWCISAFVCAYNHRDCLEYLMSASKDSNTCCQHLNEECCSTNGLKHHQWLRELLLPFSFVDKVAAKELVDKHGEILVFYGIDKEDVYVCRRRWQKKIIGC